MENRSGAGAATAAIAVAKARPDGHTMLLTGNGTAISSALFKSLPYDLNKDFEHISSLASFDLAMITSPDSGFNFFADVLVYARANPGKLSIGTSRVGSTQHLVAETFTSMAGIDLVSVPYRITSDMGLALRAKAVSVAFEIILPVLGQIRGKTIVPLAITASGRFTGLSDVPTLSESGVPNFEASSWVGVSVPALTFPAIIGRLAGEIRLAVASPEVQRSFQAQEVVGKASTPEKMTLRIDEDMFKWKTVIEKTGIPRQ